MPTAPLTSTPRPSTSTGSSSAARTTWRRRSAAARLSPGSRTANSSLPSRATVALGGAARRQPIGDLTQHRIAAGVPEAVVDLLEAVEVDEQHGGALSRRDSASRVASRARLGSRVSRSWVASWTERSRSQSLCSATATWAASASAARASSSEKVDMSPRRLSSSSSPTGRPEPPGSATSRASRRPRSSSQRDFEPRASTTLLTVAEYRPAHVVVGAASSSSSSPSCSSRSPRGVPGGGSSEPDGGGVGGDELGRVGQQQVRAGPRLPEAPTTRWAKACTSPSVACRWARAA